MTKPKDLHICLLDLFKIFHLCAHLCVGTHTAVWSGYQLCAHVCRSQRSPSDVTPQNCSPWFFILRQGGALCGAQLSLTYVDHASFRVTVIQLSLPPSAGIEGVSHYAQFIRFTFEAGVFTGIWGSVIQPG